MSELTGAISGALAGALASKFAAPKPPDITKLMVPNFIIFTDGKNYYAKDHDGVIRFSPSNDISKVIWPVINALPNGGVILIKDIDPSTFTIKNVPNNVLIIISYAGTLTLMKPNVNIILNNFGNRSFEQHTSGNTIRLRDNTDPTNMIDLYAIDPVTGDIHFFVNESIDNMNLSGFLGRNNLPPGRRWLNKNGSPVKVVDAVFRNDNIFSFRTGDPTIDGQGVVDRFGFHTDGRLYRVNSPPPSFVSPIPTPPYRPDTVGAVVLYFVISLAPTASADASAVFDISPDNVTWFNAIAKAGVGAGGPGVTQTIVIYVKSGWYVRWTLTNASIVTLFKDYL
jgi:hypothetical protein